MADKNSEDEILKRLESANKDEAKNIILETILPQCRDVASSFFDCVENKMKTIDFANPRDYENLERQINEKFVPECMGIHNLEDCLASHEKKI
jgi:hypothetical protein